MTHGHMYGRAGPLTRRGHARDHAHVYARDTTTAARGRVHAQRSAREQGVAANDRIRDGFARAVEAALEPVEDRASPSQAMSTAPPLTKRAHARERARASGAEEPMQRIRERLGVLESWMHAQLSVRERLDILEAWMHAQATAPSAGKRAATHPTGRA